MYQLDDANTMFRLAADLIHHTDQHLFLTGKAGTGKTTFLKQIREQVKKNAVILAPTGVAAINAGGVTIHSFFQLPRGMFIPENYRRERDYDLLEINDRHSLLKNIHFNANKRQLVEELELLVIDEVSMVRCDLLDAIDVLLRHYRKAQSIPFGGVQVVYIGDLFQLPPVVSNDEWKILSQYYASPFFFSGRVLDIVPPLYIELKKIYRQSDPVFIDLLNKIRNNEAAVMDFDLLNSRLQLEFEPPEGEHYITITSHNKRAETINMARLAKLPGKTYSFPAIVKEDFSEKAFPTESDLQLKPGAQVMFIKNDSSSERRYYNGKIVEISSISEKGITVKISATEDLLLEVETWKNVRYVFNKEENEIEEEELGSFTQFPIRLAWAITIHKSQGLSFERAIIDAGSSFAPGQVYVALSRCTSMNGMILTSRIHQSVVSTDPRVIEFSKKELGDEHLIMQILDKEKFIYSRKSLIKLFDWSKLQRGLQEWIEAIVETKLPDRESVMTLSRELNAVAEKQNEIARKFQLQLEQVLVQTKESGNDDLLRERMHKAILFFVKDLIENLILPLRKHMEDIDYVGRISRYKKEVKEIDLLIWGQIQKLLYAEFEGKRFYNGIEFNKYEPSAQKPKLKGRQVKGSSKLASFELFREGKSIEEISKIRNMSVATIEQHLSDLVGIGSLTAIELLKEERLNSILKIMDENENQTMSQIKSIVGESFSWHEIRVAMKHLEFFRKQAV